MDDKTQQLFTYKRGSEELLERKFYCPHLFGEQLPLAQPLLSRCNTRSAQKLYCCTETFTYHAESGFKSEIRYTHKMHTYFWGQTIIDLNIFTFYYRCVGLPVKQFYFQSIHFIPGNRLHLKKYGVQNSLLHLWLLVCTKEGSVL